MPNSEDVVKGQFWDYGRGPADRYRWLYQDSFVVILTQFLGILLTIASARLVKLVLHTINLARRHRQSQPMIWPGYQLRTLNASAAIESTGYGAIFDGFSALRSAAGPINLAGGSPPSGGWREAGRSFLKAIVLLSIYFAIMISAILIPRIAPDHIALADGKKCGIWRPNTIGQPIYEITSPYEYEVQMESSNYARLCYGGRGGSGEGCNLFLQQSIPYHVVHNHSCPFADDMCYWGPNSAFKLTTGAVSARALGINTQHPYQFNRTTVCTALNMNETFIKLRQNGTQYTFSYHYGKTPGFLGNTTWETHTYGDNFDKVPVYSLGAFVGSSGFEHALQPIDNLVVASPAVTTLLLIQAMKIYYVAPSDDPIFPANKEQHIPGEDQTFWMYNQGHARPMACVDFTAWRDLSKGREWHSAWPQPRLAKSDEEFPGTLRLFRVALLPGIIYQTLSKRLAYGLNATARIGDYTSLPLAREQWKVEATQLFETSLARMQFEARNLARGEFTAYKGYARQPLPAHQQKALCHNTYLFTASGWTSINALWYLVTLIPCSVIILLAWPVKPESRATNDPEILLFEWLLGPRAKFVSYVIVECFRRIPQWLGIGLLACLKGIAGFFVAILGNISQAFAAIVRLFI